MSTRTNFKRASPRIDFVITLMLEYLSRTWFDTAQPAAFATGCRHRTLLHIHIKLDAKLAERPTRNPVCFPIMGAS
jgi:hypothetical protein